MTPRENALEIIRFGKPERIVTSVPAHDIYYHGCNHEGYEGGGHDMPVGTHWTDVWGTVWYREHEGVMGFPRGNPLAETTSLRTYRWPDPNDPRLVSKVHQMLSQHQPGEKFLCGWHRDTLWEKSYMLVGMENMMEYFHTEPQYARDILHGIMDFHLGMARHYLDSGVDMVFMSDDLGTQGGPLLGPAIMREFLMPEYRRLFSLYRSRGVLIYFHSCGCIEDVIPDLMELGIDILNPVQATANNLASVRELTQGRVALQGGVSTGLIAQGPVDEIVLATRRAMWQLGRQGGYFCAPDQGMPFPDEHIKAFRRTVADHGTYPLQNPDQA